MHIADLCLKASELAKEKGFHETPFEPCRALMLVVTELAEAVEHHRNGYALNQIWLEEDGKPDGFPIELADAVIRLCEMCGRNGIDLESAIAVKMAYNRTRPYRHGGKAA